MATVDRVAGWWHVPVECSVTSTPDLGRRVRICSGVFEGIEGMVMARPRTGRIILAVDARQAGISLEIDASRIEFI